jgi:acyl-CoA dehydrogenase
VTLSDVRYSAPESAFTLPPELEELKRLARQVVEAECFPLESKFLANNPEWTTPELGETLVDGTLPDEDWTRLRKISDDTGLSQVSLPVEYGGLGYGVLGAFVLAEERNRSIVPLAMPHVMGLLYSAEGEQVERYLLPHIRGEKKACYAQTEPGAGSDPGAMTTRAVRDGHGWVINGTKTFISGANKADMHLLLAVTDPDKKAHGGITLFIVDADTPGVTVEPLHTWQTFGANQFTIRYEDVRVDDAQVLGGVGNGFRQGQQFLAVQDRLIRGSMATGFLSRGLDLATGYVRQRSTFGQPLSERQAIQWMLVDVLLDLKSIRAISYECAARADRGEDVRAHAAMAKLVGANWGHRSIDKLMQVFGGMGESLEFPIVHWYRQLRHGRIGGGADEIQRILIQRAMFKTGPELWQA